MTAPVVVLGTWFIVWALLCVVGRPRWLGSSGDSDGAWSDGDGGSCVGGDGACD